MSAPATLDGLATDALLAAKYAAVVLSCDVRMQHGREFDAKAARQDQLTWDLLKEFAPSRSLKVIDGIKNLDVAVLVNVRTVTIVDQRIEEGGAAFDLKRSPELAVEFFDSGRVLLTSGYFEWSGGAQLGLIHERIPVTLIDRVQDDKKSRDGLRYFERVTCILNTTPKSEYADQFKNVR